MKTNITFKNTTIECTCNALTPILYREIFKKDFFEQLLSFTKVKSYDKIVETIDHLEDLEDMCMDDSLGEETGVLLLFEIDPHKHAIRIDGPRDLVLNLPKKHRLPASADSRDHLDDIQADHLVQLTDALVVG